MQVFFPLNEPRVKKCKGDFMYRCFSTRPGGHIPRRHALAMAVLFSDEANITLLMENRADVNVMHEDG